MTPNICDHNEVATFSTRVLKSNSRVLKTREDKVCLCLSLVCFVMSGVISLPIQNYVYKKKKLCLFKDKAKQQTRLYLSDGGFINVIKKLYCVL